MDGEDRFCPQLMKSLSSCDFEAVTQHRRTYCFECAAIKMEAASNGAGELLFSSQPPPWINPALSEAELTDTEVQDYVSKDGATLKRKHETSVKAVASTENEKWEYLLELARSKTKSDNQLELEIKKHMHTDKVQTTLMRMKLCQQAAEQSKIDNAEKQSSVLTEKKKLESAEPKDPTLGKPYQPAITACFPLEKRSVMKIEQTKRFLGIMANLLNQGTVQHEANKSDLSALHSTTIDERTELVQMLHEAFPDAVLEMERMVTKAMFVLCHKRGRKRYEPYLSMKYSSLSKKTFSWKCDTQPGEKCGPMFSEMLLRGKSDNISLPSMTTGIHLSPKLIEKKYPSNCANYFPIDQDMNIETLCGEQRLQFAMDGTTACHLMCDSFHGFEHAYFIPIEVKRSIHQGQVINYAVFAKPCPSGEVTGSHVSRTFMKYLTKSLFVDHNRRARIARFESMSAYKEKDTSTELTGDGDDMVAGIMSSMNQASTSSKDPASSTGKLYSSFNFGSQNVLIRGSMPMFCKQGRPILENKNVSYQTYVELFPAISPMVLSDEEQLWAHLKQLFKQSDEHIICRTTFKTKEQLVHFNVLQYHHVSSGLQNDPKADPAFQQRLSTRTKRMETLLTELSSLEPGKYLLLNKRDGNLELLEAADKSAKTSEDLHINTMSLSCGPPRSVPVQEVLKEFETRILFQWQLMHQRLPGCFYAKDSVADKFLLKQTPYKFPKGNFRGRGRGRGKRRRGK